MTIPKSWLAYRIDQVGDAAVGQQKLREASGTRLPYLRVANVQDGYLDLTEISEMTFLDAERHLLRPGDVVLCEGQSKELVGRAALYSGELDTIAIQNHIIRFRAGPLVLPEYALQVFRAYQKSGVFSRISKGTTGIVNLGIGRFRALPFPLPPLDLQRELASRCEELQLLVDQTSSILGSVEKTLKDLVPIAADDAILGNHSSSWSQGKSGVSPWPLKAAADVVESGAPITYGILKPGPDVEDGIPYIRGQDLQQWHIRTDKLLRCGTEVAQRHVRSKLRPNDVLLGIIRHTRVALVPEELNGANITQGTARLRAASGIDPRYLAHWLSSRAAQAWLQGHMRGIDMPGLNLRDVRRLPVPIPDPVEQGQIVDRLEQLTAKVASLEQLLTTGKAWIETLEREVFKSIVYGDIAARASDEWREAVTDWRPNVQIPELLPVADAILRKALTGAEADAEAASQDVSETKDQGVSVPVSGAQTVKPSELIAALVDLGGDASPEDLYTRLGLSEAGVDSFYLALRESVASGDIRLTSEGRTEPQRLVVAQ
ncbi:restriction endonuclease subunit S [Actinoplanes sp. NPDC049316]|uniref:restriction endonuclease subunit S n=1 Tax=Actinoplanes sp. NPDC049316 TaxID=3154727 RepID=UPI00342F0FD1